MNFQVLFDSLPPELQVHILSFLCDVEKGFFGLVCKRWRYLIEEPRRILRPEDVLRYGVEVNRYDIIMKTRRLVPFWFDEATGWTARCGRPLLLAKLLDGHIQLVSGDSQYDMGYIYARVLRNAAYGGHLECIKKFHETHSLEFGWMQSMVSRASARGHLHCIKYIYHQYLSYFDAFAESHSCRRRRHCRRSGFKCREYRRVEPKRLMDICLVGSSRTYRPECMDYARSLGATDYVEAIKFAAMASQMPSLIRIRNWRISLKRELENRHPLFWGENEGLSIQQFLKKRIQSVEKRLETKSLGREVDETAQNYIRRKKRYINRLEQCIRFLDKWENED